ATSRSTTGRARPPARAPSVPPPWHAERNPLLDQSAPTGPRETGVVGCGVFGQAGSSAGSLEPVPLRTAGLRACRQSFGFIAGLGVTTTGVGWTGCAGAPCTSTTVAGADCTGGCSKLRRSLSVFAVPVLVAVATAAGAGFLAASPSAETILSLLCFRYSRSPSLTLRSVSRSWLTSASRDLRAEFSASLFSAAEASFMHVWAILSSYS